MTRYLIAMMWCGLSAGFAWAEGVSPEIQFSADERSVAIRYGEAKWNFVRPVVSRWEYKAEGKTYWVEPGGDDGHAGSAEKPVRSIGKAVALAQAGDVVYLRAGTYVEAVMIRKSGEEGRPIVVSCAPGALGKVKVTPPKEYVEKNPRGAVITLQGARHVWVNGLIIEGPRGRGEAPAKETYGANGITWAGRSGVGCRATNNVVYSNVHCGLKEMGHGGIGILMEANVIFENGMNGLDHGIYCPASEVTINGNILFGNAGYGIHSYSDPKRQRITRNICVANKAAGIILAGAENEVSNNVFALNGMGIFYYRGGCRGNVVRNNIFAFNKRDGADDNGGGKLGSPADNVDDYNCYFPTRPDAHIRVGAHEVFADPLFRDAKIGDFRLKDNSPCVGGGIDGKNLGAF